MLAVDRYQVWDSLKIWLVNLILSTHRRHCMLLITEQAPSLTSSVLHWPSMTFTDWWPSLTFSDVYWPLLTFGDLYWPSLTYSRLHWSIDFQWPSVTFTDRWPLLTFTDIKWPYWPSLTFIYIHWHSVTFIDLQWPLLTFIDLHCTHSQLMWVGLRQQDTKFQVKVCMNNLWQSSQTKVGERVASTGCCWSWESM